MYSNVAPAQLHQLMRNDRGPGRLETGTLMMSNKGLGLYVHVFVFVFVRIVVVI